MPVAAAAERAGGRVFQRWHNVLVAPSVRLAAVFEESTEYDRLWTLPFHALSLCLRDDPADPSWAELPESGGRMEFAPGAVHFTAAGTPMRLRYTPANVHLCIHFRCEVLPGIDALSGVRGRFLLETGGPLASGIRAAFADGDPVRRLARAEAAALGAALRFWPDSPGGDPRLAGRLAETLREIGASVDARTEVRDLAARSGLSADGLSRTFREAFGTSPKQWLLRVLFDRALRLLADPARSVKEVAYALDFSSEFNFSRFVKRRCGLSPTQLRAGAAGPVSAGN